MKENILKIKEWWSGLASREKHAISIGGVLTATFIVYQWMLAPFYLYVADMRERIQSQEKLLVWMQAADADLAKAQQTSQGQGTKTTPIDLLSAMQKKITTAGLAQSLTQLKQANNDSIEIQFQKVSFDKMISLIIDTLKEQKVTITQMTVSTVTNTGSVNVTVVLKT